MLLFIKRTLNFLLIPYGVLMGLDANDNFIGIVSSTVKEHSWIIFISIVVPLFFISCYLWFREKTYKENAISHVLNQIRKEAFGDSESHSDHENQVTAIVNLPSEVSNRLTIFKATRNWCGFRVLKCVYRAGNTTKLSRAKFRIDKGGKPEGVVGVCYRQASAANSVIAQNVKEHQIPKDPSERSLIEEYAKLFNLSPAVVRTKVVNGERLIASIEAGILRVNNLVWGVVVFDSDLPEGCRRELPLTKMFQRDLSVIEVILGSD